MTNLNEVMLRADTSSSTFGEGVGEAWIDDLSLTTILACEKPVISEYRLLGEKQLGFNIVNTESVEKTVRAIKARYNNNNSLVNTEVFEIPVGKKKSVFKSFAYPEKLQDGYYKYFVWDGFETIKPLVEAKEVR